MIGYAFCGSFCTHKKSLEVLRSLVAYGHELLPIVSDCVFSTDTRFGTSSSLCEELYKITGREAIHTIVDAEPLGPKIHLDAMIISPCTGNTLAKLARYKYEDGIFYSELLLDDGFKQIRLDSRTSDAIAIALRVNCPIYATIKIITDCGVVLEDGLYELDDEEEEKWELMDLDPEEITDEYTLRRKLSFMREEDLVSRLEEAVKKENYEYAKMYKDELRRRKEEERESW